MKFYRGYSHEFMLQKQFCDTLYDALLKRAGGVLFIYDDEENLIKAAVLDEYYDPETYKGACSSPVKEFYKRWAVILTKQLKLNGG